MSHVRIEGLTKLFDGKPPTMAIDDLDLEIEQGEFLVLLGPSGCGKTTTLRCLAGLETPARGASRSATRAVFDAVRRVNVPPNKRNIGMVFQSYALWPHMTVRKNIAYPLRRRADRKGDQAPDGSRRPLRSSTARACSTGTRPSSAAASSSASRSPVAWSRDPTSCSSTSR